MNIQEALEKVTALLPGAERLAKAEKDLATATESITALQGKLSTAEAAATDFKGKLEGAQTAHAKALEDQKAEHAKAITDLNAKHTTALEEKEKDVEKRAGLKAQAIAAKLGLKVIPKEEDKGSTGSSSADGKTTREQYNDIKDPKARAEFYNAHKEELLNGR